MDKNLYLKCDFEAVFLINGALVARTGKIAADDEEEFVECVPVFGIEFTRPELGGVNVIIVRSCERNGIAV